MFVISQIDFTTSRQRYVSAYLVLTALNYLVIPASVQKFIIITAYYKYSQLFPSSSFQSTSRSHLFDLLTCLVSPSPSCSAVAPPP